MLETKLDCQMVQVLMFLVARSPYLSREQDGRPSLSLFLTMLFFDLTQDSRKSSYVIVHDM